MAGSHTPTTLAQKFEVLHRLGLPVGHAVVTGSLCLEVAGVEGIIADDIDILCDQATWSRYSKYSKVLWHTFPNGTESFSIFGAEFFTDLPGMLSRHAPGITEALASTKVVDGIPFMSEAEVWAWKARVGRPKDRTHLSVVQEWLSENDSPLGLRDFRDVTRVLAPR